MKHRLGFLSLGFILASLSISHAVAQTPIKPSQMVVLEVAGAC